MQHPRPAAAILLRSIAAALMTLVAASVAAASESQPERVPATLEAVGVRLTLPPGAQVMREDAAIGTAIVALDGAAAPSWSLRILAIDPTVEPPTAGRQVSELALARLQTDPRARIAAERPVTVSGRPGRVAFIEEGGIGDQPGGVLAIGCFELQVGMVLVSGRGRDLATIDRVVGDLFDSVSTRDLQDVAAERGDRLAAAAATIGRLDRSRLLPLVGMSQWYRIWRPGSDGDEQEIGCMRVEVLEARAGEIEPGRAPNDFNTEEREMGLMVRITARFPLSATVARNSQGLHWMAWDGSKERWSLRTTSSDGRNSQSTAITGVRAPRTAAQPGGLLTVLVATEPARTAPAPPSVWSVPEIYLSQPLRWVLGEFLHAADTPPATLTWYCVDAGSAEPQLSLRTDTWTPIESGYRLTSSIRPGAPEVVSIHDAEGRLRTRTSSDGTRTEAIALEDLIARWRAKGLPTGSLEKTASRPRR